MGEVVLLRHHPIEAIHVLIPLGHIPGKGVVVSPQGLQGILVHRPHGEVHSTEALFGAQLRGVREILNHDGIPRFLDHLRADDHSAEIPRDSPDEGARLWFETDLDVPKPRDVGANQFPEEMVPSLLPFLLEYTTSGERLFSRMRSD